MKFISRSYQSAKHNISAALFTPKNFYSARRQLLSEATLRIKEKLLLAKVSLRIHPNDGMYELNQPFAARHYLTVGLSAVQCIDNALDHSSRANHIKSILDFPSGYGRVLRFLRARFPDAEITAADIDTEMLDFCKKLFSANPILSATDFERLSMPDKFDLIWCGSLLTHLDEEATTNLLRFFYNHLNRGGICVFTTHGQFSVESLQNKTLNYGLTVSGQQKIVSQFREKGYGYTDYEHQQRYGISAVKHERMLTIARSAGQWNETSYVERGWDNHQDVYGFSLRPPRN
jgi:SAM-dependent methyltransferase